MFLNLMGYIILLLVNLVFPLAGLGVIIFFFISPRRGLLKNLTNELSQRFMLGVPPQSTKGYIWVHAASVGEVRSIAKTAAGLKEYYKRPVIITTSTAAGRDNALKEPIFDKAVLMPADFYLITKRFIDAYRPHRLFIVEADLWPNMIVACGRNDIPVAIINGRVSQRSAGRYKLLSPLVTLVFKYIKYVCAQTPDIAARYKYMGADRVEVTGNIKYDMLSSAPVRAAEVQNVTRALGWQNANIVTCGSTHGEEEAVILEAAKKLNNVNFIIAPRHLERKKQIIDTLEASGIKYAVLSRILKKPELQENGARVLLADTMGWLGAFYNAAGIAFVGGSISKKGGHNFLEAAILAKPVLFGKYYYNTPDVAAALLASGGGILVDRDNFDTTINKLFSDGEALKRASENAVHTAQSFKGATEKTLNVVKNYERK